MKKSKPSPTLVITTATLMLATLFSGNARATESDRDAWNAKLNYRAKICLTDAQIQNDIIDELSALNDEATTRSWIASGVATLAGAPIGAAIGSFVGLHASAATYLILGGKMSEELALGIIYGTQVAGFFAGVSTAPVAVGDHLTHDEIEFDTTVPALPSGAGYDRLTRAYDRAHLMVDAAADRELAEFDGVMTNGLTFGWRTVKYLEIQLARAASHRDLYLMEAQAMERAATLLTQR